MRILLLSRSVCAVCTRERKYRPSKRVRREKNMIGARARSEAILGRESGVAVDGSHELTSTPHSAAHNSTRNLLYILTDFSKPQDGSLTRSTRSSSIPSAIIILVYHTIRLFSRSFEILFN